MSPVSRVFGLDRGLPIDRHYIEQFLFECRADIRGRVLEIGDDTYTRRFGSALTSVTVLHATEGNRQATIVGDLSTGAGLPVDAFDCMILTQTLHVIYDIHGAARQIGRMLKPGGVVLATLPGISQISRYDMDRWGDYWRFTTRSARRLFEDAGLHVTVNAYGNVLASLAFLHGLAAEELRPGELNGRDDDYQLLITVRGARRPDAQPC
jgi:SAM-dependent methyltransferase